MNTLNEAQLAVRRAQLRLAEAQQNLQLACAGVGDTLGRLGAELETQEASAALRDAQTDLAGGAAR